ncbi:hypothetical protein JKF63_06388 [Porcisia hertigi]|uniref:Uncharacterized protein n=1 Tax=Porcisia hertigi TaxID=2761500 RepID=A0A836YHG1_9TRYP|nr:hypothetical protein JKF63_06388 [Porcisia hertigi]
MFCFTRRLGEHVSMSAGIGSPVYKETSRFFWRQRVHNFRCRGPLGKLATLSGYGAASVGAYLVTCLVVRTLHQSSVDALFEPGRDYTLEDWKEVEPTLQPGDVVLMRGSGSMSWLITTLQFVLAFLNPAALRYSHVAVVVAPAVIEYVKDDECETAVSAETRQGEAKSAASSSMGAALSTPAYQVRSLAEVFEDDAEGTESAAPKFGPGASPPLAHSLREQLLAEEVALHSRPVIRRGAIILEAMDNKDYDVADVKGVVTHDAVQLVEASRRLLSMTPSGVPAYHYFAVRRLRNYEHTPERKRRLAQFCEDNEGRRMDSSLLYPLAFFCPLLHTKAHPLRHLVTGEVSCSELIVELYQELGVVQRLWRWVPLETDGTTVPAPPYSNESTRRESARRNEQRSSGSGEARESQAQPPPPPTAADIADDRRSHSLHVYDYVYGRFDVRANKPITTRDRPLLPDTSVVENSEVIAAASVRLRSSRARLTPSWEHLATETDTDNLYGDIEGCANRQTKPRMGAKYFLDASVPPLALRAGDKARGVDGRDYQLQWYYKHGSVATCPYHFTEGAGESALDFAANVGLDRELHMHIVREGDPLSLFMEGY